MAEVACQEMDCGCNVATARAPAVPYPLPNSQVQRNPGSARTGMSFRVVTLLVVQRTVPLTGAAESRRRMGEFATAEVTVIDKIVLSVVKFDKPKSVEMASRSSN